MGLLAQVLPGIRDLRTPLAVGTLWTLAAILASRLLSAMGLSQVHALGKSASDALSSVPGAAVGSLAVLGIYLLGVVATMIGSVVTRVLSALLQPFVLFSLFLLLFLYFAWQLFLTLNILFLSLFVVFEWIEYRRPARRNELEGFNSALSESLKRVPDNLLVVLDSLISAWSPSREQVNFFVREDAKRQLESSTSLLHDLVARLPFSDLVSALILLAIPLPNARSVAGFPEEVNDWNKFRSKLKTLNSIDRGRTTDGLRKLIYEAAKEDHAKRTIFARRFLQPAALRADAERRLEQAHIRLRVEQATLYDEYDRLRAEGEFRSAVALPISAIAVALGMLGAKSMPWLHARIWLVALVAAGLVILFVLAGRSKLSDASQLLYTAVRQSVIEQKDIPPLTPEDFSVGSLPWPAVVRRLL